MRALIVIATLTLSTPVFAGVLPIAGTYGDTYGCRFSSGVEEASDWDFNWIVVTPKGAEGHEWSCYFKSSKGPKVTASCYAEGFDSVETVTVVEDRTAGVLHYQDAAGTFTLHRCPD